MAKRSEYEEKLLEDILAKLPTSPATEATLTAIKTALELIDNMMSGNEAQVDVVTSALPSGAATETTLTAIKTAVEIIDNMIIGSEAQVDVITLPESGTTMTNIALAATGTLITPTAGKALKVKGFFIYTDAAIEARLNFVTSDNTIGGLKGQGAVGMNLVGMKNLQGAVNEAIELTVTGTGNTKGWICTEEV